MSENDNPSPTGDLSRRDFQKLLGVSGAAVLGSVSLAGCQGETQAAIGCPYCDQTFDSESALKDHLPSAHAEELRSALGSGPIQCPYGDQEFDSLEGLRSHIKAEHRDEVSMPGEWDVETDVVVVGYGGSGASAALSAVENGAEVTVIEKLANGGGNTAMTSSQMTVPKKGRVEDAITYFTQLSAGTIEEDVIRSWAETAVDQRDWFESLGAPEWSKTPLGVDAAHKELDGADSLVMYMWGPGDTVITNGMRFFNWISGKVEADSNIEVMTETPAKDLIVGSDGRVRGVIAEQGGDRIALKARQGVVLACGGYGHNEELKQNTLRVYPSIHPGNSGNTGDAIQLASEADAKMWKLQESVGHIGHQFDGAAYYSLLLITMQVNVDQRGAIIVNEDGDRFVNECVPKGVAASHVHSDLIQKAFLEYDVEGKEKPNIPCYFVFDERVRKAGPIGPPFMGWSPDNTAEIEKGWIKQAETVEGLADQLGLSNLPDTVSNFNGWVEADETGPFGRTVGNQLENPPYYAVKALPQIWNTIGGPKKDGDAQVLDQNDEKIPGLYVSGVASHGLNRFRYQMGTTFSDAMVFGRIAGENVAQEESWDA